MVNVLLGQQSGFTTYPCFLCMWIVGTVLNITQRKTGLCRRNRCLAKKGTSSTTLSWTETIFFLSLHIKLGLIKQFPKALFKDCHCFPYLYQAFPELIMEKLKAGIFDGPQIRMLIRDPEFENSINEVELAAWKGFVLVVKNFLGNNKARNYAELVNNMLTAFRNLGCNMSIKMQNLFSDMDRFPENLGPMSDEQREGFHQDLKEMETSYQGRWNAVMMVDYCLNLKRDLPAAENFRSSKKRKFKLWSLNNVEATCNLRVLTFINAHHSFYSNRSFYQVINICCWQKHFFS